MFKKSVTISVDGMSCDHCANKVKNALESINGISKVKVNLNKKEVVIYYKENINIEKIETTINDLGYKFGGVK